MPALSNASGSGAAGAERRTGARVAVDVLANRFVGGYPYLCRVTDISKTGLKLLRFNEPQSQRYFGLQLQLPGSDEIITASAEIVFEDSETRAVGIRFTSLPPQSAAAIERYVSARAASPS